MWDSSICSNCSIPWSTYHTIPYHTIAIPCSMESIPGIIGWKQRHFSCHCPHSHPNTQFTTQDLHAIANLRCDFAHPVVHLASAQRYLIVWPGRYWHDQKHLSIWQSENDSNFNINRVSFFYFAFVGGRRALWVDRFRHSPTTGGENSTSGIEQVPSFLILPIVN